MDRPSPYMALSAAKTSGKPVFSTQIMRPPPLLTVGAVEEDPYVATTDVFNQLILSPSLLLRAQDPKSYAALANLNALDRPLEPISKQCQRQMRCVVPLMSPLFDAVPAMSPLFPSDRDSDPPKMGEYGQEQAMMAKQQAIVAPEHHWIDSGQDLAPSVLGDEATMALQESLSDHSFDSHLNFVCNELDRLSKLKKKRRTKRPEEIAILKAEYAKSAQWSSGQVKALAKRLSWPQSRVYKWNWDKNKRGPKKM